jgi:soluble lytic murein transglycosylase-like protein
VAQNTVTAAQAVARTTAAATSSAAAAVAAVAAVTPAAPPALKMATAFAELSEQELREKIKWVPVRWGGEKTRTLDETSRLMLAQAAAEEAGLDEVGLSFEDVYGVIDAETSWVPRGGKGRNGVTSHGLAQFEPRTARGYGLKDPSDPVQAVYAAARYMRDGAEWAAERIDHLKLTPDQRAAKIREGVSVYYNLSIKGRNKWDGLNTAKMPVETQRHIRNVRQGAEKALDLAEDIAS